MSRFLLINFEDFGLNQDITKTIQPNTPVCICCLDNKSPFINLLTCTHTDYLKYFSNPPELKQHNQVVCYECHAILIKIKQFKLQVENSFRILKTTSNDPLPVTKKNKILSYHKAVDVLITSKFPNLTKNKNIETSQTVTMNKQINMKNIQIGLDIINKNKQNASMIGVLAQGLETLKTIGFDTLKKVPVTLKVKCNREDIETETNAVIKEEMDTIGIDGLTQLPTTVADKESIQEPETTVIKEEIFDDIEIKEEIVDNIEIKEEIPECNGVGNVSTIIEEKETDIELPVTSNTVTEQSQIPQDDKVRQVTITYEELMKERSLIAQSKMYTSTVYKCENCLVGFKFIENFEDHVKRKHDHQDGYIKCEVCHQTFQSGDSHNMHMFRHYNRYECISCNERFKDQNDAVYHYKNDHTVNVVRLNCLHCDFTTDVINKLKQHSLNFHKMFTCKICGQQCSDSNGLAVHFAKAHKKKNKHVHKCKKCPQSFRTKLELQKHEDIQHIMKYYIKESKCNSYICSFCQRIYKFKSNLEKHLQNHIRTDRKTQVPDK